MHFPWQASTAEEQGSNRWLRWRFITALLLVSAVPFVVVGSGAWIVFRRLAIEQTLTANRTMARAHAAAIDMYLTEKLRTLEMVASTNSLVQLTAADKLGEVFAAAAAVHQSSFVDIGVIDEQGRHLAYVGPFDLKSRIYRDAEWFHTVMAEGFLVSDVFLGYRQIPHSVIAVRRQAPTGWWILRATIDNRSLYELVRSLEVGTAGDVFIVNQQGLYQTPPKVGDVLDQSPIVNPTIHHGVNDQRLVSPTGNIRQVTTWLNHSGWLLVVQQPESEILAPVNRAAAIGALLAAIALALVVVATILVTSHLTRQVEFANQQRDVMYADLIRSAKLASLGELATGLAHEINNPLATISAEQTNLGDVIGKTELAPNTRASLENSIERCKRQVERCGNITAKMLQFGRKTDTALAATPLEPVLTEIAMLLERRVRTHNAALNLEIEPGLPAAWLDANELEQVLVNLVNNAIDALNGGGLITMSATRDGNQILLRVSDDGNGVAPTDLDRIFQPFFTTKPVGRGTGLGLSVVYGIVRGWGGTIHADSAVGQGTTISIRIPLTGEARQTPPAVRT
jgi:two-component system NtrC family sensor kinase